jgi:PAS domain S-box-containing protein
MKRTTQKKEKKKPEKAIIKTRLVRKTKTARETKSKPEKRLRVLILEDNAADAELMVWQLRREKTACAFRRVETRAGFLKGLKEFKPDLILADYTLPGFDAMKALKLAREKHPFLPFIVVTGTIGEEKAVACLRAGADDYLLKDRLGRLGEAVHHVLEDRRLQAEKTELQVTLQRATADWLTTFDAMNDAVCLLDAVGAVRRCNRAMNRLLGLPFRRIIGRNCLELICGKQKRAACAFQQAKKDLRRHQEETLWRGRWYQVVVNPIVDDKGRLSGAVHVMTDISEHKGAEKALRDSEERFRRLYDESPVAFQSLDTEGRFIEVNAAWLALFGYHREEVIGKPFPTFLAAGQADLFHGRFAEFLRRKVVHSIEFRMRKKDGDELIISFDGIFLCDIHGRPIHSNCVLQNITERKRAEELLRENEERFRSLYENTTIGMYRTTPNGRIVMANPTLVHMLGYGSFDELTARDLEKEGFEPEYPRRNFRERIEREGRVLGLESAWKRRDGTTIFVRESAVAVRDREGNALSYNGTVEDITERKRAEEALLESEERFRKVFEESPLGMVLTSRDLRFFSANPAFCRMLGYSPEEMSAKTFLDVTHPDHRETDRKNVEKMWQGKIRHYRTEKRYIAKDGDVRWGSLSTSLIMGGDGKPLYALAIIEDITDRKQAEQQIRYQADLLNNVSDAIMATDRQFRIQYWNAAAEKLYGWKASDVMGHHFLQFIRPQYTVDSRPMVMRKIAREGFWQGELEHGRCDGTNIPVHSSISAVRDSKGRIIGHITVNRDISERKKWEQRLTESEIKFRKAFVSHPGIVGISTFMEGRYIDVNQNFSEILGWSREEVIGRTSKEIGVFSNYDQRKEMLANISRDGSLHNFEVKLKTKTGRERYGLFSAETIEINGQKCLLVQIVDVTERKQAEIALQEMNEIFRLFLKHNPIYVFIKDENIRPVFLSENYEKMLGRPLQDILGRSMEELFPSELSRTMIEDDKRILREGIVRESVEELDGRTYSTIKFPIFIQGKARFLAGYTMDISERKKAEEALRKSRAQLAAAMEIAKLGHWELDVESGMFTFSDSLYAIFHTTASEMGGYQMPIAEYARRFVHPEDASQVESETRKALETNDPHFNRAVEHRIRYADGGEGHIAVHYFVVKNAQGKTVKTYGVNQDISERKRMEVALRESEQRYRQLVEMSPDAIAVHAGGRIVFLNPAAVRLRGAKSAEELLGKSALDMVHPDSRASAAARIQGSLEQGIPAPPFNEKFMRADGSAVDVEVCAVPITFEGQPAMQVIIRDISERLRAEQALRESEEKFRTLVENLVEVAFTVDAEGRVTYISPGIKGIFGYAAEEIIGRSFLDFVSADSRQKLGAEMARTLNEPAEFHEYKIRTRGGVEKWISSSSSPIIEKGVTLGVRGIMADVTARKIAEEALRISEARYRLISDNANDVIWLFDVTAMRLTYVSPSVVRLRGYTVEEVMRQSLEEIFTPESFRKFQKALRDGLAAFQAGEESILTQTIEIDQPHKDGHVVHTEIVATLLADEQHRPQQVLGVSRDITERKQAEERIRSSLQEKEVLLKEIHHRVKNNLQIISGLLTLQAEKTNDERLQRIIKESQSRIWTMALIHQTLYQSGNLADIDMADYIRTLSGNLLSSQARLAMPPTVSFDLLPLRLAIDKAIPLALIINELLTNAMKYAFPDGRLGEIRIGLQECRSTAPMRGQARRALADTMDTTPREGTEYHAVTYEMIVSDNGVGLPQGFDAGDQKTLGLQLVAMLAKQMGGTVAFESKGGTSIRVVFACHEKNN